MFVARDKELTSLKNLIDKNESSFVAIYGRRRIGKTATVRHFCKIHNLTTVEITGKYELNKQQQIKSFINKIDRNIKKRTTNWGDAFYILEQHLSSLQTNDKKVVFLDELPWMDSAKSGFIGELGSFWNDFCDKRKDIILIVCGSAASYMLNKIIHNKGPLHGRLTKKINMKPFDLNATKQMVLSLNCNYSNKTIIDAFMVFGGIAKYLKALSPQLTLTQNVNNICFKDDGLLVDEYENLFSSLFKNSKVHYNIMDKLSTKWSGYTQKELSQAIKISSSYIKIPLNELLSSGFISATTKFGQEKRDLIYRSTDCFSYFYNKWMKNTKSSWENISLSSSYKSWSGFAFENICHIHIKHIKQALGILGVDTKTHYWKYIPKNSLEKGTQIDMLLEHTNGSKNIDIIECKYYNTEFAIDKKYKQELQDKIDVFNQQTNHKYNIRLILITVNGIKKNEHYNEIVNQHIDINDVISAHL